MKHLKIVIAILILATILIGCRKLVPEKQGNTLLYAETINNIKKGEPLSLTFGDDEVIKKVAWAIAPNSSASITIIANNATIIFSNSGTYVITATMGDVYATYTVTVDNIEYIPNYGTTFTMTAPKFVNINQNEPIVFSALNANNGTSIAWSWFPAAASNVVTDNIKKTATFTFTANGPVAIYASNGVETIRRTVWIGADMNPDQDYFNFILGDKLQLIPSLEQSVNGKKLVIIAKTNRKYHCETDKILSFSVNNEYIIDYSGVSISRLVCNARSTASTVNSFKNMTVGTHPFTVNFANKTYTGTVALDATGKYTFTWLDASVVSISPLVVGN